jgi:protein-S-isoprenylcysteine O-methyltransferase Ste14
MKRAVKAAIVAIVLVSLSILVVLTAATMAAQLASEASVFARVILPMAIGAGLLVVYFDWRAKLRNRILADRYNHRKAA